jgi:hypothetical protein
MNSRNWLRRSKARDAHYRLFSQISDGFHCASGYLQVVATRFTTAGLLALVGNGGRGTKEMTDIQKRLEELSRRLDAAKWTSSRVRNTVRMRRQHLTLLGAQLDALREILEELAPTSMGVDVWQAIRCEFDAALGRLERSLEWALAREEGQRGTRASSAAGGCITDREAIGHGLRGVWPTAAREPHQPIRQEVQGVLHHVTGSWRSAELQNPRNGR